jgi:hypothetical protein
MGVPEDQLFDFLFELFAVGRLPLHWVERPTLIFRLILPQEPY